MALDPKFKAAIKSQNLTAIQEAWATMSDRQRPSPVEIKALLWTTAPVASPEVAEWLLEIGADPEHIGDSKRGKLSIYSRALERSNVPLIEWLILNGYQPPHASLIPGGPTPLAEALFQPTGTAADVAQMLIHLPPQPSQDHRGEPIQAQADLNQRGLGGETLLAYAAGEFKLEALVWLVEQGADPLIRNDRGDRAEQYVRTREMDPPYNADELYAFMAAYTQACQAAGGPVAGFPISNAVLDQRAVERVGMTFLGIPEEDWTEDMHRAIRRFQAYGMLKGQTAPEPAPEPIPGPAVPPRRPRMG